MKPETIKNQLMSTLPEKGCTDTELDNDNMWAIFRAYCEKRGMKSFKDIILRDDTQEG